MGELKWAMLVEMEGRFEADLLKSYLEAEGIPVQLFQEGTGQDIYPVNFGPLAMVQVFVPGDKIDAAQIILQSYKSLGDDNTADLIDPDTKPED
jgi:hypothetical protein